MSENLPNKQSSEEVDLGQLFNAIGRLFEKFFKFIGSIFRAMVSSIVFVLKAVIDNFKIILAVAVVSGIIGYALEKTKPVNFESKMYVKPYFDSKYQLVNNINYFNALISNHEYAELTAIFDISVDDAKHINGFKIDIGPESENEKIKQYDLFVKSIDSVRAQEIDYDAFIENRNIFSTDLYEISVKSQKKDIFLKLEEGLNTSFQNTYSEKKMKKRDSLIYIQKQTVLASLKSVDSLQKVYINVLEEESKSNTSKISLGESFSLESDKSKTREFDLLNKEIELRKELRMLDEKKVEEDVYYDTLSGFQAIGSISTSIFEMYSIIFPILSFIILCLIFATKRTINFVKNYEA